ncbi:hypothetical protein PBY51_020298 [Eleginops maclovinus]|uniref:C-type lectin domain-containing protein n=2 Tax=Eleginops maclovinus TaxID=56733 RepID=A0AAN8AKJ5_ELEMC|nr:hypothetical protein PBY51_020298 [Eleginops maclovinus]
MMALTRANVDENISVKIRGPVAKGSKSTVLAQATGEPPRSGCLATWTEYGDRCFFFEPAKRSWAKSELHCQSLGGNLVSIHNYAEYNHTQQMTSGPAWVGGAACQDGLTWLWSDGLPMYYDEWCPNQPKGGTEECCLQINSEEDQCWDDISCNTLLPSICVKATHRLLN